MSSEKDQTMTEDIDARHNAKMAKIKAARDKMMETKTEEKGLIIVHTGAGKGKSSSGFGMIMRCIAHGMPCAVVQFIKGTWSTGEKEFLRERMSRYAVPHAFEIRKELPKSMIGKILKKELVAEEKEKGEAQ